MQLAGQSAYFQLHFSDARCLLGAALIQHRRMGNVHDAAYTLGTLGKVAMNERRFAEAGAYWGESLGIFRTLQDRNCGAFAAEAYAATLLAQGDNGTALHEAEAAAAAFRELGDVRHHALARVLGLIATIHTALGNRDAARQALREALGSQRHASLDINLAGLLEKVAAMHPDAPSAPALLGSAAAMREQSHNPVFPAQREEYERCYAAVRAKQEPEEFERSVASGRALARDEAIGSALSLLEHGSVTSPVLARPAT
jgi:tetratricopeptide (TPR) repeat protein